MLKQFLGAMAIMALVSGCATVPDSEDEIAQAAGQKEVYCQTDDGTGSRLAPRTVCSNGVNTGDQSAVRAMQSK